MPPRPDKKFDISRPLQSDDLIRPVQDTSSSKHSEPQMLSSPATDLQYQIETAYDASKAEDEKWSPRQTFIFLLLVCGGFWGLVGLVAFQLF